MNKIFRYCRISTKKQNIVRQIKNIERAYPDITIVCETFTGTKIDYPTTPSINISVN